MSARFGDILGRFLTQKPCSDAVRVVNFSIFKTFAFLPLPGPFFELIFETKKTQNRFLDFEKNVVS